MMRRSTPGILVALAATVFLIPAAPVWADGAVPRDCACIMRDGGRVPLGQTACLTVGGRSYMARCAWSLNLLTWRKLSDGCPLSALYPSSSAPLRRSIGQPAASTADHAQGPGGLPPPGG